MELVDKVQILSETFCIDFRKGMNLLSFQLWYVKLSKVILCLEVKK